MSIQFKTITNKYPTKCRRCKEDIHAGERVRWAKGRGVWHFANECERILEEAIDEAF